MSLAVESIALFLLGWIAVLHPNILRAPVHDYHFVRLVPTPMTVNHAPQPVRILRAPVIAHVVPPSPQALHLPPESRPEPPAPKVEVAENNPAPVETPQPVIPRQMVKTDVFSTGSSAAPTTARVPQQVQTGGFGDPNGVPARENNGKSVTIAQLGAFDLPSGQGNGNGTGGARGTRGVVASAGFGDGVAKPDTSHGRGAVRESGFGDSEPAAQVRKVVAAAPPRVTPAEIVSKPNPIYTEEARKLKLEGEVLLEVVFEATGKLRVVRVVRGLGHGLDEAAIQAAEQIHFKPALREGQPADSTAVLHIVFQLA